MKTHRFCRRCGNPVTKVTNKESGWRMRNIYGYYNSAYQFDCKHCDEYLFRFETKGLSSLKKAQKFWKR